jgi:rhamnosyltransferase
LRGDCFKSKSGEKLQVLDAQIAKPSFVVCLAAYNGMAFIREQIESILNQHNVTVSVVVSVDLSTDGTENFLHTWAATEPRILVLPCGERFGGAGLNFYRLLRDTELNGFDYLSFADQDDLWDLDRLNIAHNRMNEVGAQAYSSNFTAFWPSGKEMKIDKSSPQKDWDFLFESAGPGCTYVLSKDLAIAFQQMIMSASSALKEVIYHDWLCYAFARAKGYVWHIDNWASIRYRQHENNQIGVNAGWRSFWRRFVKIVSGHGFSQARLIAELVGVSSIPIVQRGLCGQTRGYLWLAQNAGQCRRKKIDQIWFFMSCLSIAFVRPKVRPLP